MSTVLKLRGGTSAEHAAFTGAEREVTVDVTAKTLVVHDGSTQGGSPLARATDLNSPLREFTAVIDANYTIPAGSNALAVGTLEVATGVTLEIPANTTLVVL